MTSPSSALVSPLNSNVPDSIQKSPTSLSKHRKITILLLFMFFVFVLMIILSIGFYYFTTKASPEDEAPSSSDEVVLFQTCLASPFSDGCYECKENGEDAAMCVKCEYLFEENARGQALTQGDQAYFREYCSTAIPETSEGSTPTGSTIVNGETWVEFSYSLPKGGKVEGLAPASHAFGTDSSTASELGNTIGFVFDTLQLNKITTIRVVIMYSEGMYYYYPGEMTLVDSNKSLYRYIDSELNKRYYYTDSYETETCDDKVSPNISARTDSGICGTGMLFNHGMLVSCGYEGEEGVAIEMCDTFIKNLELI